MRLGREPCIRILRISLIWNSLPPSSRIPHVFPVVEVKETVVFCCCSFRAMVLEGALVVFRAVVLEVAVGLLVLAILFLVVVLAGALAHCRAVDLKVAVGLLVLAILFRAVVLAWAVVRFRAVILGKP